MIFDNLKELVIPEGNVVRIEHAGRVLWEKIIYTIQTITGVNSITIPEVVNYKGGIVEITQYGKTEQDDTPTPSTPVDIKCNNGVMRMVDDELPTGYKRLTGISFDGNFYYKTGEYLTSDDDVTMTLDNLSANGKNVFGFFRSGSRTNFSLYIYGSSSAGAYFRFGDQLKRPIYGDTGRRTITFGAGGTSGFATDVSVDPDEFTTPANVYIGMLPNSTSPPYDGDIVGSILVGTRLEWIPCESDDGIIGYYERVNGNFIVPTGSGTPVSLGYDTTHLIPRMVGTPEVLSVGKNLFSQDNYLDAYCAAGGIITEHNSSRCFVMECKPNTEYRFIFDNSAVTSPRCVVNGFATLPEIGMRSTQVCYSSSNTAAKLHDATFTTDSDVNYLVIWLMYQKNDDDAKAAVSKAVLMETETAQNASVVDLLAIGNYKDEQDIISGTITRQVGVKVLDGTEGFSLYQSSCWAANVLNDPKKVSGNGQSICSHYAWTDSSIPSMADSSFLLNGTERLCIKDSRFETAAQFKAYLADQYAQGTPVIVLYPLAEETTDSTTPQTITTSGTTTISADSNYISDIGLKVDYYGVEK